MSGFWSGYVIILTVLTVIGSVWLMWSNRVPPNEKNDTTGHTWDGDLAEYNNPMPRWWLWLFYLTVAFSVAYVVLYPGLGGLAGTLGWSQVGQYEEELLAADERYGAFYAQFEGMDLETLSRNDAAMSAAHNIFGNNCAQCHGSDGRGARGFPNLADDNWQYGGDPETILTTIRNGRNGVMPAQAAVLGSDQAVDDMVEYVRTLGGLDASAERAARAKQQFTTVCAACHMPDGTGMQALGAPNLTDDVWLHGSSREAIRHTLVNGRMNQMPAQLDSLGEDRVRLLAAYVLKMARDGGG
jgi:cytochrome c oxidase cbb3-type subunit 3